MILWINWVAVGRMTFILLYSMELINLFISWRELRSGLLGSRTDDPYMFASVDVDVESPLAILFHSMNSYIPCFCMVTRNESGLDS